MIRKYLNADNWNIGFLDNFEAKDCINLKGLPKIKWMTHEYQDRAFADPHILNVTDSEISVLCEELAFGRKGRISKLVISRPDFRLKQRKVLLQLPTHLSYPAIFEKNGNIFVYPENSESGRLTLYKYHPGTESLEQVGNLADDEVTDFTICPIHVEDNYFALATKLHPDSQVNTYLFASPNPLGPFTQVGQSPVVTDRSCSRPGGSFFTVDGILYRPAQDCRDHYGQGLKIMKVESFIPYLETEQFEIFPDNLKYHLGIHTLNFKENVAIVDGYGYLYPMVGRILTPLNKLRRLIKSRFR